MPVGRYFILALFLCVGSPCLAQDMRTVVEPKLPPVCVSLGAEISATKGEIDDNAEKRLDTRRIQAAIDSCKPGTSVQLQGNVDGNAFLTGPLELKTGITLLVAQNTTLFGSRNPRDYDTSPGSCGVVDQNG
ncbi:MAG TPA: glycoside hydrolase, partial [Blastocatellia bacterium]|nr:glycoside hydrolase [Blastocatellia bacterium]